MTEGQRANRIRYSENEMMRYEFYKMPQFLYTPEFIKMGSQARELYMLMKDRLELSLMNRWKDEENYVYIYFSRDEMMSVLDVSAKTLIKIINVLKEFKLMEEDQQGQGRPNRIYPLMPENVGNTKTWKYSRSAPGDIPGQEVEKFQPIYTYKNQTELNHTQEQQTVKNPHPSEDQAPVVVSELVKKSKRPKAPTPDISFLSFITELTDTDKLSILQATGNDIPNIHNAYDMGRQQGGIENLAGWIIHMVGKLQNGEITLPVKVKRQTVNRFVNYEQRGNYDYAELERLEREQCMG